MDSLLLLATVACAHRDDLRKRKHGERPTLPQCYVHYHSEILGTSSFVPKCKNKGAVGLELERLFGIPKSSDCLDCAAGVDGIPGEIKAFPVTEASSGSHLRKAFNLAVGDYITEETVAITMVDPTTLLATPFESSRLCKKINNVLFVPYSRNGDSVLWLKPTIFTPRHPLYAQIKKDYETIQDFYRKNQTTESRVGRLLQVRTKGPGGKAKRTHAFYFRRQFLIQLFHPSN
jgi:DNA mismatch repair protein MutH